MRSKLVLFLLVSAFAGTSGLLAGQARAAQSATLHAMCTPIGEQRLFDPFMLELTPGSPEWSANIRPLTGSERRIFEVSKMRVSFVEVIRTRQTSMGILHSQRDGDVEHTIIGLPQIWDGNPKEMKLEISERGPTGRETSADWTIEAQCVFDHNDAVSETK